MRVWTTITLLLLCEPKVHCDLERHCSRKETPDGVLTLPLGSHIVLGCRGDVTVDGIQIVAAKKHREKLKTQKDTTIHWTTSKTKDASELHHSEFGDMTLSQNATPYVTPAHVKSQTVSTSNPPLTTTQKGIGTRNILRAVSQPTPHNRKSGVTEGKEVPGITIFESSENIEFDDYEDFEETKDGVRVTRSIRRRAHWTRNGQPVRTGVEKGGILRLPEAKVANSGNYSCYRSDKLVSSVKLSVGVAPEVPALSCFKKSHTSKIRCEWISRQPIIPRPQCSLLLTKGLVFSRVNCSYSPERSRCWCAFPCEEGDDKTYGAKLCVSNTAGSAMSPVLLFTPPNIIKPDPPSNVSVAPVEGAPRNLRISWNLPRTWNRNTFYILEFRLRYRPKQSKKFQDVSVGRVKSYLISDALLNTEHEIQLKAKDDFDGVWSDWTSPVYGQPWTAPERTRYDVNVNDTLESSCEDDFSGSGGYPDAGIKPPADSTFWYNVLWVVGLCLFISITMITIYFLRRRASFLTKKGIPTSCSYSSPPPHSPTPLVAPLHQSPHYFLSGLNVEGEAIHLHNVDYFFSSYGQDASDS